MDFVSMVKMKKKRAQFNKIIIMDLIERMWWTRKQGNKWRIEWENGQGNERMRDRFSWMNEDDTRMMKRLMDWHIEWIDGEWTRELTGVTTDGWMRKDEHMEDGWMTRRMHKKMDGQTSGWTN